MRNTFLLPALLAIAFASCDVIDDPENPIPGEVNDCTGVGNGAGFRRVLIEDLTGFRCPNCPQAAEAAALLKGVYCEDLIVVAVHCTPTFASPTTTPPDPFSTDLRTVAGEAYVAAFSPPGLPNGLVSRRAYSGSQVVGFGDWSSAVADILGQPAQFEIEFEQVNYNVGTQTLDLDVRIDALRDTVGEHNLVVYLLESGIVEGQEDNRVDGGVVYPYTHDHVLRDNINGTWGTQAFIGNIVTGQDTLLTFSNYVLPANVLDANNCSLVAYIYRVDNDEVMQVSERKLIQ
jgi:hypothetical protein